MESKSKEKTITEGFILCMGVRLETVWGWGRTEKREKGDSEGNMLLKHEAYTLQNG